jgi:flavin reductase (DIM6/NTAB) family NADH-FMN oxidoreductase RutF
MAVERAEFRRAAGRLPTGILVVATTLDGADHAMTVSAFTSVSLEPLLVLFCAEKIARFHDTVLAAGFWSVSVLDENAEKTARWLAAVYDGGDHSIVVGEVVAVSDAGEGRGPLLHHAGRYRSLAPE